MGKGEGKLRGSINLHKKTFGSISFGLTSLIASYELYILAQELNRFALLNHFKIATFQGLNGKPRILNHIIYSILQSSLIIGLLSFLGILLWGWGVIPYNITTLQGLNVEPRILNHIIYSILQSSLIISLLRFLGNVG